MPGSNFQHEAVVYPVMTDDLRSVFVASGEAEAQQIQAFLEASGIQCALRPGTAINRPFGVTVRASGGSRCWWSRLTKNGLGNCSHSRRPVSYGWTRMARSSEGHPLVGIHPLLPSSGMG